MASIRLRQLTRRCGEFTALALLDRDIRFRESVGFAGTAGCGMRTLAALR